MTSLPLGSIAFATCSLLFLAACGPGEPAASSGAGTNAASSTGSGAGGGSGGSGGVTGSGGAGAGTGGAGGSGGSGGSAGPSAWQTVLDAADLDGVVLSIWGPSPTEVFGVGGPLGNDGYEALVVHYDGSAWHRLKPGGPETYWWVHGTSPTDVWFVGESGRITHYNGATLEEHASGVTATLWGVFAFSPTDAYAVGGTPNGGTSKPNDIVLHWDGSSWTSEVLPGAPLGRTLYKVWGSGADDIYAVGEKGTIWHKKGGAWTLVDPAPATGKLFTVSGCGPSEVYAVGGSTVLRSDGLTWQKQSVSLTNLVNGVACGPSGRALIVGDGGQKQRLVDGAWVDEFTIPPFQDLHAAWSDDAGAFWAVGGDFYGPKTPGAKRAGVIARFGSGTLPDIVQ